MIQYQDSLSLKTGSQLDAKLSNFYRDKLLFKIESPEKYLLRLSSIYRIPGVIVTMLVPKADSGLSYTNGYISYNIPGVSGINYTTELNKFDIKYYTFIDGIADSNFKEVDLGYTYVGYASDDMGNDFSLIPSEGLTYIAILTSPVKIENISSSNFDGLWFNASYILPIATSSTLGGVKIGTGISISPDGTISVNNSLYKGTWNANTNTPTIQDGVGVSGWWYRVIVGGTWNSIVFEAGDDVIYNGTTWERIPGNSFTLQPATSTFLGGVKIGNGISVTLEGIISTNTSQIDHDLLYHFVSNKHIDHSAVSIIAGTGMNGGGDLTISRTINHNSKNWVNKTDLTGATVISNLTIDSTGHPVDWTTRTLTATNIGAEPTVTKANVTAGSSKISLGGTPNSSVFSAFSIDVVESNLTLNNIGGILSTSKGGTGLSSLGTQYQLLRVNSSANSYEFWTPTYISDAPSDNLIYGRINNTWQPVVDNTYTHPTQTPIDTGTLSGANVISRIVVNNLGHTTLVSTRALTLSDLGYTGATNANYYVHPNGFTNQPSVALLGANVISQLIVNTEGHVTGVTSRALTLSDLGYSGATNADNYSSWNLQTQNSSGTQISIQAITSGVTATLRQGSNITLSQSGGVVTISSTDTNTTYSAGTGLSLNGTTFNHTNAITADTANEGGISRTLAFGGTFNIPSISYDSQGHITTKGLVTLTMPTNPGATVYSLDGSSGATNSVNLELLANGVVSDSINFVGTGTATVSWDETNQKLTINSTNTDTNYYPTAVSFTTGSGILSISGTGMSTISCNLDGRYSLLGHTHNYDNYGYWYVGANGTYDAMYSGTYVNFIGSGATSISKSYSYPTETITISSSNYYPTSLVFNDSTRVLTLSGTGISTLTATVAAKSSIEGGTPYYLSSSYFTTSGSLIIPSYTTVSSNNNIAPSSSSVYSSLSTKQDVITLTTTGTSGAATLVGNTLNIPQYSTGTTNHASLSNLDYSNSNHTGFAYKNGNIGFDFSVNQLFLACSSGASWLISDVGGGTSGLKFSRTGQSDVYIDYTGSLHATDYILYSDINLKENINNNINYEKVSNVNFVEYNFKGSNRKKVGIIAQELEKDLPNLVYTNDDGIKSVSYIDLLILKIIELENRIKKLENNESS